MATPATEIIGVEEEARDQVGAEAGTVVQEETAAGLREEIGAGAGVRAGVGVGVGKGIGVEVGVEIGIGCGGGQGARTDCGSNSQYTTNRISWTTPWEPHILLAKLIPAIRGMQVQKRNLCLVSLLHQLGF